MRLGFIIQHIGSTGGTERACVAVMNGLAASANVSGVHLFELCAQGAAHFALDARIEVSTLFARHVTMVGGWLQIVRRLRRALIANRIETLVVVEATHALYAVAAARLAGVRVVVWEHFNFAVSMGKWKRVLGRRIAARYADAIVVLTARDIALWCAGTRVRAQILCIPNPAPQIACIAPYDPHAREVVAAGRLSPQKGFDLLLAAWALVEADARSEGWSLAIYGDGPERTSLLQGVAGLSRALLAGANADLGGVLDRAGLFVLSSRFEGLPMVLLEALAHGLPAVAFDCETGPAEIIVPGKTGLLVRAGDVAALAEALLAAMADPALRGRMAQASLLRAGRFEIGPIIEAWHGILWPLAGVGTASIATPSGKTR